MIIKLSVCVLLSVIAACNAMTPLDCDPVLEQYQTCPGSLTKCETTCDNYNSPSKNEQCPCEEACVCKYQYVRNLSTRTCVYRFQCPMVHPWWLRASNKNLHNAN